MSRQRAERTGVVYAMYQARNGQWMVDTKEFYLAHLVNRNRTVYYFYPSYYEEIVRRLEEWVAR